jgi:hypothetical protein
VPSPPIPQPPYTLDECEPFAKPVAIKQEEDTGKFKCDGEDSFVSPIVTKRNGLFLTLSTADSQRIQNNNSTNMHDDGKRRKSKESTHPKTSEEGFSVLVPREISFSVDIPTQLADDIPTQPTDTQQSDAEDDNNGGADGNVDIGQDGTEDAVGAAGGEVMIVVGGNN